MLDENTNGGGNIVTLKRCVHNIDGRPIGFAHINPLIDSREHVIELDHGITDRMLENNIADKVCSKLDDKGIEIIKLKEIIEHR